MNHQQRLSRAVGLGLLLAALAALPLQASAGNHQGSQGAHKTEAAAAETTDGEVRKVDVEQARVTLKHAEIKSLDMPAMTMVFLVKDKALLSSVKAGDKVKFRAVNESGKYTITEMQVVP